MQLDREKTQRRIQLEIDRILLKGAPRDWMTIRGYVRADGQYLPREVALNIRIDQEVGTVQLILADGSRVLEFNEQEGRRLMGLLQLFLFPKEPDPRQLQLVRNIDGEELAHTE